MVDHIETHRITDFIKIYKTISGCYRPEEHHCSDTRFSHYVLPEGVYCDVKKIITCRKGCNFTLPFHPKSDNPKKLIKSIVCMPLANNQLFKLKFLLQALSCPSIDNPNSFPFEKIIFFPFSKIE